MAPSTKTKLVKHISLTKPTLTNKSSFQHSRKDKQVLIALEAFDVIKNESKPVAKLLSEVVKEIKDVSKKKIHTYRWMNSINRQIENCSEIVRRSN